ncbi:MAG: hypothetical protein JST12_18525 [Armatimonadetes bacterium]|nr:hypothetical protein [Armatimonadota bacterium]
MEALDLINRLPRLEAVIHESISMSIENPFEVSSEFEEVEESGLTKHEEESEEAPTHPETEDVIDAENLAEVDKEEFEVTGDFQSDASAFFAQFEGLGSREVSEAYPEELRPFIVKSNLLDHIKFVDHMIQVRRTWLDAGETKDPVHLAESIHKLEVEREFAQQVLDEAPEGTFAEQAMQFAELFSARSSKLLEGFIIEQSAAEEIIAEVTQESEGRLAWLGEKEVRARRIASACELGYEKLAKIADLARSISEEHSNDPQYIVSTLASLESFNKRAEEDLETLKEANESLAE